MKRRALLTTFAFLGGAAAVVLSMDQFGYLRKIWYRLEDLFSAPPAPVLPEQRKDFVLPQGGHKVSLEKALNSRCTSDGDGNPKKFHWGMFDPLKRITPSQVAEIARLAKVPRFTDGTLSVRASGNVLTVVVGAPKSSSSLDSVMVEGGMMQQAICLVCSALGIGNVFENLGVSGTKINDREIGTVELVLDAMVPGYGGSCWTDAAPEGGPVPSSGGFPLPRRDGSKPLLDILRTLKVESSNGREASNEDIGQLLWAARGRTPHYVKSEPRGITIPTWGGDQTISSVWIVADGSISKYRNWEKRTWAHGLESARKFDRERWETLRKAFDPFDTLIVFAKHEQPARALWEVGYQLLNAIAQASALDLRYKAILLDRGRKPIVQATGIEDPVAVLLLKSKP